MPRKDCPARQGKVKLRNPHWREITVYDEFDPVTGYPTKWHYVSEPVISTKHAPWQYTPVRHFRRNDGRSGPMALGCTSRTWTDRSKPYPHSSKRQREREMRQHARRAA